MEIWTASPPRSEWTSGGRRFRWPSDLQFRRAATPAHVDPRISFQALIREESALDPHALSWAGAVGLSQPMVPTARQVARQLNLKGHIDAVSLQQPELNLRIGSTYAGELLKKFGGNPVLALAAYNAGAGAVTHWMSGHELEDLDAFVEDIPVAETRGYVKRVLQSFTTYQLLYGASAETHLPAGLVAAARARPRRRVGGLPGIQPRSLGRASGRGVDALSRFTVWSFRA